jgi:hypothetical protein
MSDPKPFQDNSLDEATLKKLIPLREVTMWEACDRPRNTKDAHASTDRTLQRFPANPGKALFLFLTPDHKTVLAQDPESLEVEEFPITTVRQYQRLTERHIALSKAPIKPGLVHNLTLPKPDGARA